MGTPGSRITKFIPAAFFACGALLIAAAVTTGEAEVSLVVIFPVFTGSSWMFVSGVLLIIAGFISFFLTVFDVVARSTSGAGPGQIEGDSRPQTEGRYGGLILLGPVPIAFGSDHTTAKVMLAIGIALAVVFVGIFLAVLLL